MKTENITIRRTSSYGRYIINGTVNGVEISVSTTDSEAFDYLNDDEFVEKQQEAINHCTLKLEQAFEQL